MARVHLKPGMGNLSGTVGNLTFRTINGKTFVFEKMQAVLPENASREEKRRYKKRLMIDACLLILQQPIDDLHEAIRLRPKMRLRLSHLYDRYCGEIKARTKLQKKIMSEYYSRYCLDNLSITTR